MTAYLNPFGKLLRRGISTFRTLTRGIAVRPGTMFVRFTMLSHRLPTPPLSIEVPMINFHRGVLFFHLLAISWGIAAVHAQEPAKPTTQCPNPGEPCKILIVTQQEEKYLMMANGVLDSAAQARAIDLGQFVVYFKQKLVQAPLGGIK